MRKTNFALLVLAGLGLGACGHRPGDTRKLEPEIDCA